MSQGEGQAVGPWNQGNGWKVVSAREKQQAVDGGDGQGTVDLSADQEAQLLRYAARTRSKPGIEPVTGAELGARGSGGSAGRKH